MEKKNTHGNLYFNFLVHLIHFRREHCLSRPRNHPLNFGMGLTFYYSSTDTYRLF